LATPAPATDYPPALGPADFLPVDAKQAAIGQLLFYDKILSGNRNISCATCHHPAFGSSDGTSLGIGEGGVGLGPTRTGGEGHDRIERRVPRNAPALWNLGASEVHVVMHDGRVSRDPIYGNGFNTPAEEWLPQGLNSVLAAQALFPMASEREMAGGTEENEVSGAVFDRIDKGWPIIAKRVRSYPQYGQMFVDAFDHIEKQEEVTIVEIANSLAAFMSLEFRSFDSPFDAFLAGDEAALNSEARLGAELFFGEAGCSGCHAGARFSDLEFHALGLPGFGPGRTRKFDLIARDVGRMGESDSLEDAYRFKTPSLRNIALTGPYGHNGAYRTIEEMIRHHLDPEAARAEWTTDNPILPDVPWLQPVDFMVRNDRFEMARQNAKRDIFLPDRTDAEIASLVAFLNSLTGTESVTNPPFGVPDSVPSGLPVDKAP
jgi:cytochrome c peroxidase